MVGIDNLIRDLDWIIIGGLIWDIIKDLGGLVLGILSLVLVCKTLKVNEKVLDRAKSIDINLEKKDDEMYEDYKNMVDSFVLKPLGEAIKDMYKKTYLELENNKGNFEKEGWVESFGKLQKEVNEGIGKVLNMGETNDQKGRKGKIKYSTLRVLDKIRKEVEEEREMFGMNIGRYTTNERSLGTGYIEARFLTLLSRITVIYLNYYTLIGRGTEYLEDDRMMNESDKFRVRNKVTIEGFRDFKGTLEAIESYEGLENEHGRIFADMAWYNWVENIGEDTTEKEIINKNKIKKKSND